MLLDEWKRSTQKSLLNILPGGETFLHILADKPEVIDSIYKKCHENIKDKTKEKIEVPFLLNFKHKSIMDILNDKEKFKDMDMIL